ncbi:MAG: trypsin-like serine protease, partial [Bacteroidia bacterium]|nr:trypsin-like serine protease [Bacteroidia bacterium]
NTVPEDPHPNSYFTSPARAKECFSVSSYPVRTAVKLYYFRHDTIYDLCSGTMVAPNLVLTSGHCLFDIEEDEAWFDSLLVLPAYDQGESHPMVGGSTAKRLYLFKSYVDNDQWDDIGMIELNEPIGGLAGWAGFGYNETDSFYINNVFHCFSYPAVPDPDNAALNYSGNNMYYQTGMLDQLYKDYLGINVLGIPGQSGSGLMYTDNQDFVVYGVRTFSGSQSFFKINKTIYTGLNYVKEVLADPVIDASTSDILDFKLLPTVFDDQWNYVFMAGAEDQVDLQMLDLQGNLIIDKVIDLKEGVNTGELDLSQFASAEYQVLVRKGNRLLFRDYLHD